MSEEVKTKMCSHCHRILPVTMFNKRSSNKTDGLQYACRECSSKMAKEAHDRKKVKQNEAQFKAVQQSSVSGKIVLNDGTVLKKKEAIPFDDVSLSTFSNRQILEELKSRGYVWDNMWIKVKVDYNKI